MVGLFTFDARFLARPDFWINRFAFFLETLKVLRDELRALGGDLLVLDVGPREAFQQLTAALSSAGAAGPSLVTFNRDYEPFAQRDAALLDELPRLYGVPVETFRDHLLIEPDENCLEATRPGSSIRSTPPSRNAGSPSPGQTRTAGTHRPAARGSAVSR